MTQKLPLVHFKDEKIGREISNLPKVTQLASGFDLHGFESR